MTLVLLNAMLWNHGNDGFEDSGPMECLKLCSWYNKYSYILSFKRLKGHISKNVDELF